jgi:hypothetical protein
MKVKKADATQLLDREEVEAKIKEIESKLKPINKQLVAVRADLNKFWNKHGNHLDPVDGTLIFSIKEYVVEMCKDFKALLDDF